MSGCWLRIVRAMVRAGQVGDVLGDHRVVERAGADRDRGPRRPRSRGRTRSRRGAASVIAVDEVVDLVDDEHAELVELVDARAVAAGDLVGEIDRAALGLHEALQELLVDAA